MITATIVDDEPDCCESLITLLERHCARIKVLDACYSAEAAIGDSGIGRSASVIKEEKDVTKRSLGVKPYRTLFAVN